MSNLRTLDTPVYKSYHALFMALYSRALYVDVFRRWRGTGYAYLLLAITFAAIPFSLFAIKDFNDYYRDNIERPLNALPPLPIQFGILQFNKPMPYVIMGKPGKRYGVIDTSGRMNSLTQLPPEMVLLVTKDTMYFSPAKHQFIDKMPSANERQVYEWKLKEFGTGVFYAKEWLQLTHMNQFKWVIMIMIYPATVILMYSIFGVILLALAVIAKIFGAVLLKQPWSFQDACRVFMVSCTAYLYFFFLALSSRWMFQSMGLVGIGLITGYFYFAVMVIKHHERQLVLA